jgi:anhydro-N-acetylmuramic acid kinase
MKNNYKVIGLMSGTSLDGLDIACVNFLKTEKGWEYFIGKTSTLRYSSPWLKSLANAHNLSGQELIALDAAYGNFLGKSCADFIKQNKIKADFISSHGHTIFHQPQRGFTYQLGNGNALHAATGLPVVFDLRSLDVILGGQGAPLVPVGDKFLFSDYDICLNLGGIANLSMDLKGKRIAYDICFCNMSLNYLMQKVKKNFDEGGTRAASGEINKPMFKKLGTIYEKLSVKKPSLGREIFEKQIKPLLDNENISLEDRLHTSVESTALEISKAIKTKKNANVLCTGGGAFNSFMISRILEFCGDDASLIIPEDEVVKFKEALVFAFLGVLRVVGEVNCLQSVTGASRDSSSGLMVGFRN